MLQITRIGKRVSSVYKKKRRLLGGGGTIILVKYNVTTVLAGTCLVDLHWSSYSGWPSKRRWLAFDILFNNYAIAFFFTVNCRIWIKHIFVYNFYLPNTPLMRLYSWWPFIQRGVCPDVTLLLQYILLWVLPSLLVWALFSFHRPQAHIAFVPSKCSAVGEFECNYLALVSYNGRWLPLFTARKFCVYRNPYCEFALLCISVVPVLHKGLFAVNSFFSVGLQEVKLRP